MLSCWHIACDCEFVCYTYLEISLAFSNQRAYFMQVFACMSKTVGGSILVLLYSSDRLSEMSCVHNAFGNDNQANDNYAALRTSEKTLHAPFLYTPHKIITPNLGLQLLFLIY